MGNAIGHDLWPKSTHIIQPKSWLFMDCTDSYGRWYPVNVHLLTKWQSGIIGVLRPWPPTLSWLWEFTEVTKRCYLRERTNSFYLFAVQYERSVKSNVKIAYYVENPINNVKPIPATCAWVSVGGGLEGNLYPLVAQVCLVARNRWLAAVFWKLMKNQLSFTEAFSVLQDALWNKSSLCRKCSHSWIKEWTSLDRETTCYHSNGCVGKRFRCLDFSISELIFITSSVGFDKYQISNILQTMPQNENFLYFLGTVACKDPGDGLYSRDAHHV